MKFVSMLSPVTPFETKAFFSLDRGLAQSNCQGQKLCYPDLKPCSAVYLRAMVLAVVGKLHKGHLGHLIYWKL